MAIAPKNYTPADHEQSIYSLWEQSGAFTPKIDKKQKPFTIILPLPNANDPMHMGHCLFTVEDILVRWHRMMGEPTLWLPGGDHAGIETQYVFEKVLSKEGKSRFDFDRATLYQMIAEFVDKNKNLNKDQMKLLGFSMDWTRYHYSMEPEMVNRVLATFRKLHADGLVYRGERMVNFCTRCGTAFSDLEVDYVERQDPLYYLKYGPFTLATTRPETKFGDTAVAVNPGDKRYQAMVGKEFVYESLIGPRTIKVIADDLVDPEFGTGAVKVTPAHDPNDYEMAKRHQLPIVKVITTSGRLNALTDRFAGLTVNQAREKVVAELQARGDMVKIDTEYVHRVGTCYRCGHTIEPMLVPQWYLKVETLAKPALAAVHKGYTKIVPKKRFEKMYIDWLQKIYDWNISRQIVWGPRIPVWYCLDCNPDLTITIINPQGKKTTGSWQDLQQSYSFEEVNHGLQSLVAGPQPVYTLEAGKCQHCQGNHILQETDTFDTWFLSSQWPVNTLKAKEGDFEYFYPTSVLDTLWDILFFWVARMMMMGIYLTADHQTPADRVPFKVVHIHARVVDKKGQKMSKSKGNVINPIETINKYGADALRLALVLGVGPGSDIALSEEKIRAMRNFVNKLWNAGRYVQTMADRHPVTDPTVFDLKPGEGGETVARLTSITKSTQTNLKKFRFGQASEDLYQYFWHDFCDQCIEQAKQNEVAALPALVFALVTSLRLLHPFIPFVTETVYQALRTQLDPSGKSALFSASLLITSPWPTA